MTGLWICPACGNRSLTDHCASPTCTWHHCRNKLCDLVADVKARKGHRLGRHGTRERWSVPA